MYLYCSVPNHAGEQNGGVGGAIRAWKDSQREETTPTAQLSLPRSLDKIQLHHSSEHHSYTTHACGFRGVIQGR